MKSTNIKHPLISYGPETRLAYVGFVPSGSNGTLPAANIVDSHGVASVRQLATGKWEVNLEVRGQSLFPEVSYVHSGSNNQHEVRVLQGSTTGSFQVQHLSSGSLSNTCDQIWAKCFIRVGA